LLAIEFRAHLESVFGRELSISRPSFRNQHGKAMLMRSPARREKLCRHARVNIHASDNSFLECVLGGVRDVDAPGPMRKGCPTLLER